MFPPYRSGSLRAHGFPLPLPAGNLLLRGRLELRLAVPPQPSHLPQRRESRTTRGWFHCVPLEVAAAPILAGSGREVDDTDTE